MDGVKRSMEERALKEEEEEEEEEERKISKLVDAGSNNWHEREEN